MIHDRDGVAVKPIPEGGQGWVAVGHKYGSSCKNARNDFSFRLFRWFETTALPPLSDQKITISLKNTPYDEKPWGWVAVTAQVAYACAQTSEVPHGF